MPHLRLCLPPSPPCAALVTSRHKELPGLPAGAVTELGVMTEEQALELLRGVPGLGEALEHEPQAAKDLARTCCYHPLALDIAARRLLKRLHDSSTPVAAFTVSLRNRLAQLKLGESHDPQQNLEANIGLSYEELEPTDQVALAQAGGVCLQRLQPGGCRHLWRLDENQARLGVGAFCRMRACCMPGETAGRWQLHDLLHEYAQKQMVKERNRIACAEHADYLIQLFDEHYIDDPSTAPEVVLELDNLVSAAGNR